MVLECPLMASEEDMEELAHTAMVVQAPFMGCQDLEDRGDIMLKLQPMVLSRLLMVPRHLNMAPNLLHMAPNLLHMAPNLLLMIHLLHKPNQPMMQLLRLMHLLPTVFLLAMGVNLLLMELRNLRMVLNLLLMVHNLELSSNLEVLSSHLSSSLLLYLRL